MYSDNIDFPYKNYGVYVLRHNDNHVTGHWLNTSEGNAVKRCSVCGESFMMRLDLSGYVYPYDFCPNCGSRNDITFCDTSLKME